MKRIVIGAMAIALATGAYAQAGMAPSSPVNGSTPNGATPLSSPGDSGSGMGTMDHGAQSMASDPATTDKGMTKPHSRHKKVKSQATMAPSDTAAPR